MAGAVAVRPVAGPGAQGTAWRAMPHAYTQLNIMMDRETMAAAEFRLKGHTFRSIEPCLSEEAVADDDDVHAPAPNEVRPTPISASEFELWVILLSPLFGEEEDDQTVRIVA